MPLNENEERLALEFDNALKLRDEGNLVAARKALELLSEKLQPSDKHLLVHTHMQLGNICDQLEDHAAREIHFRTAVEVAPKVELASLGLYHTLREQGRLDEALQEMLRLLRLRDSELYDELLGPRYGAHFSTEQQKLIAEARQLIKKHRRN